MELRAALHLFTKAPYNLKITAKELECYVADFFEDYKPEEGGKWLIFLLIVISSLVILECVWA